MVECSFGFLSESIDFEQKSLDFEELEIGANAVIYNTYMYIHPKKS